MSCPKRDRSVSPCKWYLEGGFCSLQTEFRCVEYVKETEFVLSYSQMRSWIRCHRKWFLQYIEKLEPIKPSINIVRGRIIDECLNIIHSNETKGKDYMDVIHNYRKLYKTEEESREQKEIATIELLLDNYMSLGYANVKGTTQYEWLWDEPDYPKLHGFLDLLVNKNEAYEFKYTMRPSNYDKFTLTDQLSTYFLGCPNLKKIIVRTIQVPELRQAKDETNEQFIERLRIDIKRRPSFYFKDQSFYREEFDEEMRETAEQAKFIAKDISRALKRGKAGCYPNRLACLWPVECDFKIICETGVISDNLFKKRGEPYESD